ncbi:MAG: hypothetical protein GY759_24610 [Chloroflexi bacterium]|nr:hypothetical protein [Chloroflexota bacterium]
MKRRYLLLGIPILALAFVFAMVLFLSPQSVQAAGFEPICLETALQEDELLPYTMFLPYQSAPCDVPRAETPFYADWAFSPHNNEEDEAFRHWDDDEPPEISTRCAKCHSTSGYQDFLGADGSEEGVVNEPVPVGETVECVACHNDVTESKTSVTFPSGDIIEGLGPESRCMECHQGRQSGLSVDAVIEEGALPDDDTPGDALSFPNIHYFAAAATRLGSEVNGGYEYDDEDYDEEFLHVEDYDECNECHSVHTLELKIDECAACHVEEDPEDMRMPGSMVDYDGDGDITEGIYHEVEALEGMLYAAIQAYAAEYSVPIMYDETSHPYWFYVVDGEKGERYDAFTNRLLKACYNYQVAHKDPGQFAHNAKYIIQLLHDSIADLNTKISNPVDLSMAHRNDVKHFDGTEGGHNSRSCNRCHNPAGLPLIVENPNTVVMDDGNTLHLGIEQPGSANSLECSSCHEAMGPEWTLYGLETVQFPGGPRSSFGAGDEASNLCLACHQGRESGAAVAFQIGDAADDDQLPDVSAGGVRVHYYVAGATLFGTEAKGMYEYEGKTYKGALTHLSMVDSCAECHNNHSLGVKADTCTGCHGATAFEDINMSSTDWDGNGTVEGVKHEIDGLAELLYTDLKAYAETTVGACIVANGSRYAIDTNCNGELDGDEGDRSNRYNMFTPKLLRATYNYAYLTYERNDPGAFTHNPKYVLQVLYDGLENLGHDMTGLIRP